MINPTVLEWDAPTTNVDGSPITEPLNYTMLLDGSEHVSFPGSLNPSGKYTAQFDDMSVPNGTFDIGLLAFYVDAPELKSSATIAGSATFLRVAPNAPTNVGFS